MPENGNVASTLLPVALLLTTLLHGYYHWEQKPTSTRPTVAAQRPMPLFGDQDVQARLWQDPFDAVGTGQSEPDTKRIKDSARTESAKSSIEKWHTLADIGRQLRDQRLGEQNRPPRNLTIMPVMLEGSPYPEDKEVRLRLRYAVQTAFAQSGYVPYDRAHLGYFRMPWSSGSELQSAIDKPIGPLKQNSSSETLLTIPFEWFDSATNAVLVLWLQEEAFADFPLGRLGVLVASLKHYAGVDCTNIEIALLGPRSSNTLKSMLADVSGCNGDHARINSLINVLTNFTIYSPNATAPDFRFPEVDNSLRHFDFDTWTNLNRTVLNCALTNTFHSKRPILKSFITTDDCLAESLIHELSIRNFRIGEDKMLLVAESDTEYARTLPYLIVMAAKAKRERLHLTTISDYVTLYKTLETNWPSRFARFSYLRGLDGSKPLESTGDKTEAKSGAAEEQLQAGRVTDFGPPQGDTQIDYVHRMIQQLLESEQSIDHDGSGFVKAIGILGSDVYDKLILLQPLRKAFPEALFFTTDLDARYLDKSQNDWTRNLIVASGQSLGVRSPPNVPPFRDAYETAVFKACRAALGAESDPIPTPYLYEIGRRSAVELGQRHRTTSSRWPFSKAQTRGLVLSLAGALGLAFLLRLSNRIIQMILTGVRSNAKGLRPVSVAHLQLAFRAKRDIGCVLGVVTAGLALAFMAWHGYEQQFSADGEPFRWFEGVSIWPSELLRIAICFTSAIFLFHAWQSQKIHVLGLLREYFFVGNRLAGRTMRSRLGKAACFSSWKLPREGWVVWLIRRRFTTGLYRWIYKPGRAKIRAKTWFTRYLWHQWWVDRYLRTCWYAFWYLCFGFGLILLVDGRLPATPARGPSAVLHDHIILGVSIAAFLVLSFYMVDAIRLATRMINRLGDRETIWPSDTLFAVAERMGMCESHLAGYLDVLFVRDHTTVINKLIYYPFIVLLLMLLARSAVIDHWTWPPGLVLLFAANALLLFLGALALRRAAAKVRGSALKQLKELRTQFLADEATVVQIAGRKTATCYSQKLDAVIDEISEMRGGAYTSWPTDPAFTALLLPGGGYGIFSLIQEVFF